MIIVAHRGASHDAPENTLAAFTLAWEQGADAVEGDFHLTKDGHIVAIHDDTTRRTAQKSLTVAKSTLSELLSLDVGEWSGANWQGQRIPTIEEVFRTVPPGKKIFVEIKCGPEIVPPLNSAIKKSALTSGQIVVISFHEEVVSEVKKQMQGVKALLLASHKENPMTRLWEPSLSDLLNTLKRIRANGLDARAHASIDEEFVAALRKERMELHVWDVKTPDEAKRFRDLGADSLTTNQPEWLLSQLLFQLRDPDIAVTDRTAV